ncbi:MAG: hypothetical protein ACLP36_03525 [Acidimicrobiales bacterium]
MSGLVEMEAGDSSSPIVLGSGQMTLVSPALVPAALLVALGGR